jgi:hypothetical protein
MSPKPNRELEDLCINTICNRSAFPTGVPGIALLLLRVALATALLVQGISYFGDPDLGAGALAIGLISIAAHALILVGMLTPVAGIVVALSGIGIACSLLPSCTRRCSVRASRSSLQYQSCWRLSSWDPVHSPWTPGSSGGARSSFHVDRIHWSLARPSRAGHPADISTRGEMPSGAVPVGTATRPGRTRVSSGITLESGLAAGVRVWQ